MLPLTFLRKFFNLVDDVTLMANNANNSGNDFVSLLLPEHFLTQVIH